MRPASSLVELVAKFLDLTSKHSVLLVRSLEIGSRLEEPPLKLALGASSQTLKLNHGVEQVCAGGGKVCYLTRELLRNGV